MAAAVPIEAAVSVDAEPYPGLDPENAHPSHHAQGHVGRHRLHRFHVNTGAFVRHLRPR
jgi:hypothetical protein